MYERIDNLGLQHKWFLCSLHSFVLKHILHVIELNTTCNPMSNLTLDMTRILHRFLYSNMLNSNLKNYKNRLLFFTLHVSTLWFVPWLFIQYIHVFSIIVWGFWANIVLLFCGTYRLFIASTSEIPFSQTKTISLCYYRVSLFMPTIVTCRYGYNLDLKTIVKKLFVVLCWRLLVNFNNLS